MRRRDFVLLDDLRVRWERSRPLATKSQWSRLSIRARSIARTSCFLQAMKRTPSNTGRAPARSGASILDLTYALEGEADVLVRSPWVREELNGQSSGKARIQI